MSNYNGGGQQQQRPKTVINHRALNFWTPNGEGKSAKMEFDIRKNAVFITVRTNIESDSNNDHGRIVAEVPPDYFYSTMEMLRAAAMSEVPVRWAYEHKDRKFIGQGKMTDGPVLHYRLVVGRGEDGVVYFSVIQDKRPAIKFAFLNNNKSNYKDNDGNEMPKALESRFVTIGRVKLLETVAGPILDRTYKHPEPKQQGGGNGGGGYNRNNQGGNSSYGGGGSNNGGGNNNSGGGAAMRDEDIPW